MRSKAPAILAVILLLAASAPAQEWRSEMERALARTTSYDFKEMAIGDVLSLISQEAEVNVILDDTRTSGINRAQKVTIRLDDMTYANVLSWITYLFDLDWVLQDEAIFVASYSSFDQEAKRLIEARNADKRKTAAKTWLPEYEEILAQKVSVTFRQKSVLECAESLKALLGVNIILSPDIDPETPVNLAVSKMTTENLISWVGRKAGADYAVLDQAVYFGLEDQIRVMREAGRDLSSRGKEYSQVSFDFVDVTLAEAFDVLEETSGSGVRIVILGDDMDVPRITLKGANMTFTAAVQAVTNATGLNNAILSDGDTMTVRLMKPAPLPVEEPDDAGDESGDTAPDDVEAAEAYMPDVPDKPAPQPDAVDAGDEPAGVADDDAVPVEAAPEE